MAQATLRSKDIRSKSAPKKRAVGNSKSRFAQLERKITPLLKPYVKRILVDKEDFLENHMMQDAIRH